MERQNIRKKRAGIILGFVVSLMLVFTLSGLLDQDVHAFTPWSKEGGIYVNNTGTAIPGAVKKGIDVSRYQKEIDWDKVKASGVEFAIIRCGYGENLTDQDDPYWERNVSECERLNIPYGVYLYSYAKTVAGARSEAQHVLRLVSGHKLSYPIYYDIEDSSLLGLTVTEHAQIAKAFCDTIEKSGYQTGIHSFKNWFETRLTHSYFDSRERWVAQYASACTYQGTYRMWQCTNEGSIDGIKGDVDINFLIEPAPAAVSLSVKAAAYNKQKLTWKKVSGAAGYEIYRTASLNGKYSKVKVVSSNVTSLSVSAVTGRTYYYKIRAYKNVNGGKIYGNYSSVKKAKSVLSKVSLTSVKRSSSKKVTLKWKKVAGASGYVIYYSRKKGSGYKKLVTVKKGKTAAYKASVKKGQRYYYKVRAYRKVSGITSYGAYSSVKSCK